MSSGVKRRKRRRLKETVPDGQDLRPATIGEIDCRKLAAVLPPVQRMCSFMASGLIMIGDLGTAQLYLEQLASDIVETKGAV